MMEVGSMLAEASTTSADTPWGAIAAICGPLYVALGIIGLLSKRRGRSNGGAALPGTFVCELHESMCQTVKDSASAVASLREAQDWIKEGLERIEKAQAETNKLITQHLMRNRTCGD